MSSSDRKKSIKTSLWRQHVEGLPNAAYFMSEDKPQSFDHIRYLTALNPASNDREEVTNDWKNKVVPSLESSTLPELREWVSKISARDKFWSSLKEKELEEMEKDRRRKRLARLKVTADTCLEEVEGLLVDETRADVEDERLKLQQIGKISTSTIYKVTGDYSGHEEIRTSENNNKCSSHLETVASLNRTTSPETSISKRKRVSFGRSLTMADLNPPGCSLPTKDSNEGDVCSKPISRSLRSSISSNLPSTDPGDTSFRTDQDLHVSTSKIYTWDYLEGDGRRDSHVDSPWIINEIEVGRDLMDFRDGIIQENGMLSDPHEKLAVNFIFLVEGDHQNRGLQAEVEDKSWAALCEATRSRVDPLPNGIVEEAHQWVHFLAQENPDSLRVRLSTSPPTDPNLRTQTQEDTRNADSDLLVPDFSTTTMAQKRELSLALLEGKVASNRVFQIWDDKTKLEPLVEFFTMQIHSEGTYMMRRFAVCYIAADHMNMFSIISMMEAFQHAREKVMKTLNAIRVVKVRPNTDPKVPLSWLRLSFKKPKMTLVLDGE
ncbi:hypothetical protein BGZ79_000418 [Entomortierella chlamydospora]|nr:hypothetical protein BGZ79_000418 [Entomortierella chlamydospora]